MAEELRVLPDLLGEVGAALESAGLALLEVQQGCQRAAESARSGWIGSSAGALSGLLDRWDAASIAQIGRFGVHSCAMYFAAAQFIALEGDSATVLTGALAGLGATPDGARSPTP